MTTLEALKAELEDSKTHVLTEERTRKMLSLIVQVIDEREQPPPSLPVSPDTTVIPALEAHTVETGAPHEEPEK